MSEHDPDSILVRRALSGGPRDFAPIVERYRGVVLAVALARVRSFDDAEDVAQQVFIEAFERDDLRQRVMVAVGRLNKTQRETVVLYYLSGHTQKEVARILEVPVGTVRYRLFEARIRLREDMANMVEDVLREGVSDEGLTERVLQLLDAHRGGARMFDEGVWAELDAMGRAGVAGYRQAMQLPDFRSRRAAVHYSGLLPTDEAVELLSKAASDSNRKVRNAAVAHLMGALDIDDERRRRELIPIALPLLFDQSWKVRFRAAGFLSRPEWASAIPLETAARALAEERHPGNIRRMQHLVQTILETVTGARTR